MFQTHEIKMWKNLFVAFSMVHLQNGGNTSREREICFSWSSGTIYGWMGSVESSLSSLPSSASRPWCGFLFKIGQGGTVTDHTLLYSSFSVLLASVIDTFPLSVVWWSWWSDRYLEEDQNYRSGPYSWGFFNHHLLNKSFGYDIKNWIILKYST
jgi:hypothetical protein